MEGRLEFREKLRGILETAEGQGNIMTLEEVEQYFEEDNLSKEQTELVCDYLLSQKVAVKGYEKRPGIIMGKDAGKEEPAVMSREEQEYLAEYLSGIESTKREDEALYHYLVEVTKAAQELYHPDIFIGDLIQEGNVSLMLAMGQDAGPGEDKRIMEDVRMGMQVMVESQTELKRRDKKMVEQVAELDAKIQTLSEEMGRKVTVDEVAEHIGMSEEQILDVLKLAGEEAPEEE